MIEGLPSLEGEAAWLGLARIMLASNFILIVGHSTVIHHVLRVPTSFDRGPAITRR